MLDKSIEIAHDILPSIYAPARTFHFCFAWKNNHLVEYGYNSYFEDPKVYHLGKLLGNYKQITYKKRHAETDLLIKLIKKKVNKLPKLVSIRLSPNGTLRNAKPCIECFRSLKMFGYESILYTDGIELKKLIINENS